LQNLVAKLLILHASAQSIVGSCFGGGLTDCTWEIKDGLISLPTLLTAVGHVGPRGGFRGRGYR